MRLFMAPQAQVEGGATCLRGAGVLQLTCGTSSVIGPAIVFCREANRAVGVVSRAIFCELRRANTETICSGPRPAARRLAYLLAAFVNTSSLAFTLSGCFFYRHT